MPGSPKRSCDDQPPRLRWQRGHVAAIERGYWMIEVDVRRSRDGEPVMHHDSTLEKYYGTSHRPEDLKWAEMRKLKPKPGGKPPLHFEELCAMCGGKCA